MEKKIRFLTVLIFLVIIYGIGIVTLVQKKNEYSEFEKRKLADFPKVKAKTIMKGEFQKQLNDYLNDHMVLRDQCITVSSLTSKSMGKREQNGVYFGKQQYLIEKYEDRDFSKKDIKDNVKYLSRFANMVAESLGPEKVRIALVPSKVSVLSNKLPKFIRKSKMNDYMKNLLKSKLKNQEILVDLKEVLMKHRNEYIYYKTDHHWTTLGAEYGYEALMDSMNQEKCVVIKEQTVCTNFRGTTFNKIHYSPSMDTIKKCEIESAQNCTLVYDISGEKKETNSLYDEEALKTEDKYNYFLGGNFGAIHIHTGCTNGKTLVLIKDSFANCMIPHLTYNYENIEVIDLRYLNSSIFDTLNELEQIDAVIFLFNEEKFMQDNHLWLLE
ncbi:MAG: hypothetical protein K6G64_04000 [Eubacterium sp.]|nr:hypothetical protein [Eubacterium sp.]